MKMHLRRDKSRRPTHPGVLLRQALAADGRLVSETAELIGVSAEALEAVLAEQAPVTEELAESFGKLFGNGPGLWLRMQRAHDEFSK